MADNSTKRPVRRLKNIETVRERAQKAQVVAGQQKSRRIGVLGKISTLLRRPLSSMAKLFQHQPFKFVFRVLAFVGRIISRIFFLRYFRNSWRELRLVTWPNRKQSRQLTFAVIVFAVVFGAFVSALDYGLDKLFKQVLIK
ncbi:MAG TPA: preprotein translocase subunit SecE [Candidatus Saccharimonadales bacterium]|nr:preprotein translocase subunit SecE [Candidatus Saccharimonadales bacterium]